MPNVYSIHGLTLISELALPELGPLPEPLPDTPETVHVHLEASASRAVDSLPLANNQSLPHSGWRAPAFARPSSPRWRWMTCANNLGSKLALEPADNRYLAERAPR
jgi:hypothetical protein